MIHFFQSSPTQFYVVSSPNRPDYETIKKLKWLFGDAKFIDEKTIEGNFIGPRAAMITPWSTNAVEITQNMGIVGIERIEEFSRNEKNEAFDPMLFQAYAELNQELFDINITPEHVKPILDIADYNKKEGLALNEEEVTYLEDLAKRLERPLTDAEVFGFSQVNSEHCRHKIFNGTFIIDGEEKKESLFKLIRKTSETHPNSIVSAYKDNVAFVKGPVVQQFAPFRADEASFYQNTNFESVISLKAETHNFPTTVEPFNGAATGSGGEIRDRLAGGKGSLPLAGTAVYMTSYSRLTEDRNWEKAFPARKWLYQTPLDILIKASNGASDFGNKFGQPLICGSVLTFEHSENNKHLGFDKVIMLAGGIGYGKANQAIKAIPKADEDIVILGGDNYRIGMGGAAVSSADTGEFSSGIELNAIQRSNPEMQKRAANAIRGMVESEENSITSIHDHGAGGHLNCLSELVEETGGKIDIAKLPIGDPTLSAKEIIGNESQERMGLVLPKDASLKLEKIAARERAPMYRVGKVTNDHQFTFQNSKTGEKPMDLKLSDMFGSSPKTIMKDESIQHDYEEISYEKQALYEDAKQVLQLEAVACKDWLTNKVDRCVSGRVAKQQTCGSLQLPLNNCGVAALDYLGKEGVATSVGHSPISGLIDPVAGAKNSIAEALTNIVFAPLKDGLHSVSLSANWMWPCKNPGEDARLYQAVEAVSEFSIALGINVPTGKDSLSMKQKYADKEVLSPGTVIISAAGNCNAITKVVEPVLQKEGELIYINLSQDAYKLGGSSFAQIKNKIGKVAPSIQDDAFFAKSFNAIQDLIKADLVVAGHDISAGGMLTALLEMCFPEPNRGMEIDLTSLGENDSTKLLFSENAGVLLQLKDETAKQQLQQQNIEFFSIGNAIETAELQLKNSEERLSFDIAEYRDVWYTTSHLLDRQQSGIEKADERFENYKNQPLKFEFPEHFTGKLPKIDEANRPQAAIIREKGSNSEREMARALHLAGFEVKDIHMTDLMSGSENLEDVQLIAAVGGFSNSDVLGSAKGWAGAFAYNEHAQTALQNFFAREDTLSLGVCNGCQLFIELGLLHTEDAEKPKMLHNDSGKFECNFTSVKIQENNSVMLKNMAGTQLGIWAAHGEGKFSFPKAESHYQIVGKYGYEGYPANPNGSDFNTAVLTDKTGRHLVMMPHLERSIFPWNWAHYPKNQTDEVSPWLQAFVNAKEWIFEKNNQ
ncbi:phosphoribosylformylglycinamidine synthase [Psychroflexus planctonicus]|uniref:Phosphoribosylformylglycinamidine synthase n=1 Tax=Psychroflexus planctonicus TaxID=1526575 RepID=A0ABQ1SE07_9FLAO|nr:phosphoribosylformylglycinamidine synthase [Psychroflexus planctonicus]GGE31409.1 phosphoribosylformylglycinamidine synthase [Psychroflexus planctonicus]